jgi:outer membrane biosynthesis protein TonB
VEKPAEKPEPVVKPKPADEPAALGTGIKGNGAGISGLSGGSGNGGGNGTGGNGGDLFRWYAGQAVQPVTQALRNHSRTKLASMNVVANIWVNGEGSIERARLAGSTGDTAMDAAIQNEVLPGVRLSEPPPAGMKMPIKLRLAARRPR